MISYFISLNMSVQIMFSRYFSKAILITLILIYLVKNIVGKYDDKTLRRNTPIKTCIVQIGTIHENKFN